MTFVSETATLAHGYTMADVDRITRVAVNRHYRSTRSFDYETRQEIAWDAIVTELYTSAFDPEFIGLLSAGLRALDLALQEEQRHHGLTRDMEAAPNFTKYWLPVGRQVHYCDDGFSDHLCEVLSLPAALATLTAEQYEAIATLAAFDNRAGHAADALGMKYHKFMYRVYSAREKINAVWFEGEAPAKRRNSGRTGETCRMGHSRAEHGRLRASGLWECRTCKRAAERRRNARTRWEGQKAKAGAAAD